MNNTIDLRQFRYFLAVSEKLNFGRAVSVITRFDGPIFTFVDGGFGYRWRSIFRLA